ncbi:helix-turn-helix domain-containing protein [Ekhidna sp.]
MPYNINFVNVLIAAGIFQGIIITIVLAVRKHSQANSNKYLSIALAVTFLHLTYLLLIDFNITASYSWLLWIPLNYTTAIGPLLYLYSKSKTDNAFSFSKAEFKLFIPTIVELVFHIAQVAFTVQCNTSYDRTSIFIPLYTLIYLWTGGSIYYFANKSLKLIQNHENWIIGNYANLRDITLRWLLKFISFYRWIWICWIPFIILLLITFQYDVGGLFLVVIMYTLILGVTYLTYFLGLEALIQSSGIHLIKPKTLYSNKGYSSISKEKVKELIDKLEHSMKDEKLFKDDQISLSSLSRHIGEEPNLISFMLNTHLKRSFYDFINHFRVEEAKSMMMNPDFEHYKIESIAYECGFNSKATFNRSFKKLTKMSPSDFLKHNRSH